MVAAAQDDQFEAASIKPDDRNTPRLATNLDLDSTDYFRDQGGPVLADGYLINYLIFAYKIADSGEYKTLDAELPKWAQTQTSQTFRLEARVPGHTTKDNLRAMVRSLLAERFGLKVHTETRQQLAWIAGELTMLGERRGGMDELPGVDGTQMAGKFDLDLHFVSRRGPGASDEQTAETGPDFLQALNMQVGLQFKKRTVPVEVLVVDRVNQPTPD